MKWHKRTNGNDPSIEEFDTSLYMQAWLAIWICGYHMNIKID